MHLRRVCVCGKLRLLKALQLSQNLVTNPSKCYACPPTAAPVTIAKVRAVVPHPCRATRPLQPAPGQTSWNICNLELETSKMPCFGKHVSLAPRAGRQNKEVGNPRPLGETTRACSKQHCSCAQTDIGSVALGKATRHTTPKPHEVEPHQLLGAASARLSPRAVVVIHRLNWFSPRASRPQKKP